MLVVLVAVAWALVRYLPAPMPPAPTPPGRQALAAYRVVYRVEDRSGAEPVLSTEVVAARRPYDIRVEQRDGPPPGTNVRSGTITNKDTFWSLKEGGEPAVGVLRVPAGLPRDVSATALRAAVRAGRARSAGTATILERTCTRFAYREPYKLLAPPTSRETTESCVTEDGLLLRESWTFAGKVVRVSEAVEIDAAPAFADDAFFIGRELPSDDASKLAQGNLVIDENEGPRDPVRVDVPSGFAIDRRATASRPGSGVPSQTYARTYHRGTEFLMVEQTSPVADPLWDPTEGRPFRLGKGAARIVYYVDRVELRFEVRDVPARVTAPSQELAVYVARTLR